MFIYEINADLCISSGYFGIFFYWVKSCLRVSMYVCYSFTLQLLTQFDWKKNGQAPQKKNTNQTETLHFLVMFYILLLY